MSAKFEIFLGTNRQYYFRLKAPNGEKIFASEAYTTKVNCQNGIQSVTPANKTCLATYFNLLRRSVGEVYAG
jgi:uncharacterized protein YegP (UPF0339 family)